MRQQSRCNILMACVIGQTQVRNHVICPSERSRIGGLRRVDECLVGQLVQGRCCRWYQRKDGLDSLLQQCISRIDTARGHGVRAILRWCLVKREVILLVGIKRFECGIHLTVNHILFLVLGIVQNLVSTSNGIPHFRVMDATTDIYCLSHNFYSLKLLVNLDCITSCIVDVARHIAEIRLAVDHHTRSSLDRDIHTVHAHTIDYHVRRNEHEEMLTA